LIEGTKLHRSKTEEALASIEIHTIDRWVSKGMEAREVTARRTVEGHG
jgi:hypothetical protein